MNDDTLSPELQNKLDEVEKQAAKERRFDPRKGGYMALLCFGLFFAFGIGARAGMINALCFGVFGAVVGFVCGACQRPKKQ